MHCPTCRLVMVSTSSQELQDDQGFMKITRWRCRPCHQTAEEIWLSAGYRGPDPMRIRYTVATPPGHRAPARSFGGNRRGRLAHALAG